MCTMDVVSCKISKCMCIAKCNQPKFEPRFAPQCFILYFCNILSYRGYTCTLSFISDLSLNVVHQPVYII